LGQLFRGVVGGWISATAAGWRGSPIKNPVLHVIVVSDGGKKLGRRTTPMVPEHYGSASAETNQLGIVSQGAARTRT